MELKPPDLLKEWKAGRWRPVYYLFAEQPLEIAAALKELRSLFKADDFNFREFSGPIDDASPLLSEAATLPVFSERRLIIVDSPRLGAAVRAALAQYLGDPLPSTTLILVSEERRPDSKDPLVKAAAAAGALCVFSPLKDDEAVGQITLWARQAGKNISEKAALLMIQELGTDSALLRQEWEKMLLFAGKTASLGEKEILPCLGYRKAADPFALGRLVEQRDLGKALSHWRRWLGDGKPDEQSYRALAQISAAVGRQLRAKKMLAAGQTSEAVFKALRLHSYWDRDYLPRLSRLDEKRLLRDLDRCLQAEAGLKSKSWLSPSLEIENLIVDLCGGAQAGLTAAN